MINIGTRSVLFGCHQFIIHPLFVLIAWVYLFGWPNRSELAAITFHDIGYWGSPDMDGALGSLHPELSSLWYTKWFGWNKYVAIEIRYHSRWLCKQQRQCPSRLMYADKLGTAMYPHWLWALLAHLSGEGYEYAANPKYEVYEDWRRLDPDISDLYYFHKKYRSWCRTFLLCNLFPVG